MVVVILYREKNKSDTKRQIIKEEGGCCPGGETPFQLLNTFKIKF